jgi:hypothetical protein
MKTSELRAVYSDARCNTGKMVTVRFHGSLRDFYVEKNTAPAWRIFSEIMKKHNYRFREPSGGTYNCRKIAGSNNYSLHSYGLALDLNPSKNPYSSTLTTDMPKAFRDDIKRIKTGNGKQVFEWGGDWSGRKDAMHWEVDVSRSDLRTGVSHPDTDPEPDPEPDTTEEDFMLPLQKGDGMGDRAHKRQDVRHVQYLWNHLYPEDQLEADGKFGSTTAAKLKSRQLCNADGVMGGEHYGRLLWRVRGQ